MAVPHSGLFDVFRRMKGVPPRARYLAFRMFQEGLLGREGQIWRGAVTRLAEIVGYSDGGVSSSLKKLVELDFFVKTTEATAGRSMKTYGLGPKLINRPWRGISDDRVLQILGSAEEPFKALSVPERCLLAQLWLTLQDGGPYLSGLDKSRACALTGVGVVALAKAAGVGRATAQRLLVSLHQKSFIVVSRADFTSDGLNSMTKAYFLLGPAMLQKDVTTFRWVVKTDGMLSWLAGGSEGYDINRLVTAIYIEGASSGRTERLSARLRSLSNPARRYYVFTCLCAAVSNGFFWGGRGSVTPAIYHIEAAMLRSLNLPVTGPGTRHLGIENMSPEEFDRDSELYGFIAAWAGILLGKVFEIFPKFPQSEMKFVKPPSYFGCCQSGDSGKENLQIEAVFWGVDAGDNFRAKMESLHARFGMPMPDRLGGG